MEYQKIIELITSEVLKELEGQKSGIKVGVSARHVHLSKEDLEILFGKGYELTKLRTLMGDEFASNELVTLVGPSLRSIEKVRI